METKEKIFCKHCRKVVKYVRDSREYCSDTCKDRYHYLLRKNKLKRVRLLEAITADPLSYQTLHEQVLAKLKAENDPVLAQIELAENNIKKLSVSIPPLKVQVSDLSAQIKKLEDEQTSNQQMLQYWIDLKEWIDQESEALEGKSRFAEFDRWRTLEKKQREYDTRLFKEALVRTSQKELVSQLAPIKEALAPKREKLAAWEKLYTQNKNWLSKTYGTLNKQRADYIISMLVKRPAKKSKQLSQENSKYVQAEKDVLTTATSTSERTIHREDGLFVNSSATTVNNTDQINFRLGIGEKKQVVCWNPLRQSNPHALAIGKSGSGKTAFIGVCCYEAYLNKVPLLAFDYDGGLLEHRLHNKAGIRLAALIGAKVIDASMGVGINPLALPKSNAKQSGSSQAKLTYQDIAESLAQSLACIFHLSSSVQKNELREAIEKAYEQKGFTLSLHEAALSALVAPTLKDVWMILSQKTGNVSYQNMLLRLKPFLDRNLFTSSNPMAVESLFSQQTIVNLSCITSEDSKAAICRLLLGKIFEHMMYLGTTDKLRLMIVLDEAHFLMQDESVTALIRIARKFGIGLLLASHSAKDFSETLFNIVGTKLVLRLEGSEARRMADNMGVTDKKVKAALEDRILNQEKLYGVIRNDQHGPFTHFKLTPLHERE